MLKIQFVHLYVIQKKKLNRKILGQIVGDSQPRILQYMRYTAFIKITERLSHGLCGKKFAVPFKLKLMIKKFFIDFAICYLLLTHYTLHIVLFWYWYRKCALSALHFLFSSHYFSVSGKPTYITMYPLFFHTTWISAQQLRFWFYHLLHLKTHKLV